MFTGIVENLATLISTSHLNGQTYSLLIDVNDTAKGVRVGESIAVNGVCLTVVKKKGRTLGFQVIKETLNRTNLGGLIRGSKVNIERSMTFDQRLSGHIVTGHVDGVGKVRRIEHQNDGSARMEIVAVRKLLELMVEKGAVALDGVSLTLVDVSDDSFSVCLIPHTLKTTTLGFRQKFDVVNIEADYVGKCILKFAHRQYGRSNKSLSHIRT